MNRTKSSDSLPGCCICQLSFSTQGYGESRKRRIPRILNCNHSCCEECLISSVRVNKPVICNVCKKESPRPPRADESSIMSSFSVNTYLLGLCSKKKEPFGGDDSLVSFNAKPAKKEVVSPKHNTLCSECASPATSFCDSCRAAYCVQCFKLVHAAAKVLKAHKSVPLKVESLSSAHKHNPPSSTCTAHASKKLEFFCTQCDAPICSACLISDHNGHSLTSIADKNQEFVDQIIDSYAQLSNVQEIMRLSCKKAKRALMSTDKNPLSSSIEKRIKQHFLELHSHLLRSENELLKRLYSSSRQESLDNIMGILSDQLELAQKALTDAQDAVSKEGYNLSEVLARMTELCRVPCVLVATENDVDEDSLEIDHSVFELLDDHIFLKTNEPATYDLKTLSDVPAELVGELPEKCSTEDIRHTLLAGSKSWIKPDSVPKTAPEQSLSRCSSSSSLSTSSLPCSIDTSPFLSPPDELIAGISLNVKVTYVISPSRFFVQRVGAQKKLALFQRELKRIYSHTSYHRRIKNYKIGAMYVTFYEGDLSWSRCQLLNMVGANNADVLHVDLGITEVIPKLKLMALPNSLIQVPHLAFQCSLYNCNPNDEKEWEPEAITKMAQMLNGSGNTSITIVRINQAESLSVKLYKDFETGVIDVGDALVLADLATTEPDSLSYALEIPSMPSPKALPTQEPLTSFEPSGIPVVLSHVEAPNKFYVVPINGEFSSFHFGFEKDYRMKDKRINELRIVHYPIPGLAVAVHTLSGNWERGLIVDMLHKRATVFLVDVGSVIVCYWVQLKLLAPRYFRFPPQAYLCSLMDIAPKDGAWTKEASEMLSAYSNKPLKVKNPVRSEGTTAVVLMACNAEIDVCINALMVREHLASSTGPHGNVVEFRNEERVKQGVTSKRSKRGKVETTSSTSASTTQSEETVLTDDFAAKINNGTIRLKVDVIKIVNPGEFYVSFPFYKGRFVELDAEMQKFYGSRSSDEAPSKWSEGDICAIKIEGRWKRGVISHEPDEEHLKVNLVDEANEVTVSKTSSNIAHLHSDFRSIFHRAVRCSLGGITAAGSSSWTATSVTEMTEFIKSHQNSLFISNMKKTAESDSGALAVELFHRGKVPATAVSGEEDKWISLNHELRMKGSARADSDTKWDSQGNIIREQSNLLDDNDQLLITLLKKSFSITPQGAIDYSKPLSDSDRSEEKWFPPEQLESLTFVGKPTFIGSDCEVYLQDTLNATMAIGQINEECRQLCEGKALPDPPPCWEVGDICFARFHIDRAWYRGEIKMIHVANGPPSIHLVQFVDYGNSEFVSEDDLRPAVGMSMRPIQVHVCFFDNLAPIGDKWESNQIEEIHKLLVDKNCRIELRKLGAGLLGIKNMILPNGQNAVDEIISRGLGTDLASKEAAQAAIEAAILVSQPVGEELSVETEQSHVLEEKVGSMSSPTTMNWLNLYNREDRYEMSADGYQILKLPEDLDEMTVEINSILSPNLFMMQIIKSSNEEVSAMLSAYDKLLETIQSEADSQPCLEPPYAFKECTCKFDADDQWYRAMVLQDCSEESDSLIVQFVDYGNVEKKLVNQVKTLKDEWFLVPVQSIPCELDGFKFLPSISTSEAMVMLQSALQHPGTVRARIKKRGKNFSVELINEDDALLYQDLIDKEYLIPSE